MNFEQLCHVSRISCKDPLLLFLLLNAILTAAEKTWKREKYRAIWFHIPLSLSKFIPVLAENHFKYHHAEVDEAVMYKWTCDTEVDNIPRYPFTNIGVGTVVIDSQNRVLVVKEKYPLGIRKPWKFPGGSADQGEDIGRTAEREVFEETGIKAKFHSILTMRHLHRFQFDCSDIFITCLMSLDESDPHALELKKCSQEIHDVAWIDVEELLPQLTDFNRYCLEKYWLMKKTGIAIKSEQVPFILGGHTTVYSMTQLEDSKTEDK